ncbi:MAG: hypothetical protein WB420_04950, partial [Bradyrhizobium sp.]
TVAANIGGRNYMLMSEVIQICETPWTDRKDRIFEGSQFSVASAAPMPAAFAGARHAAIRSSKLFSAKGFSSSKAKSKR